MTVCCWRPARARAACRSPAPAWRACSRSVTSPTRTRSGSGSRSWGAWRSSGPAGSARRWPPPHGRSDATSRSSSAPKSRSSRFWVATSAACTRDIHRDHGVELLTGAALRSFGGESRVERVELDDGRAIDCDLVVVGVGVAPRIELAEAAGLAVDNGILVDEHLETSVPGIFAAGDVANVAHPFYGRPLRVEHWASALHQPEVAARSMLGKPASWDRLPYFFSDQYDVGMEYAGLASGDDEVVVRGDRGARELIAFWLRDDRVVAGMNVGVWDVTDDIQALIRAGSPIDRARLADPDVSLGDLLPGGKTPPATVANKS